MYKVQTKSYSCGKRWQDLHQVHVNRFQTEDAAWEYIEALDEDGYRDTGNYRVVKLP